MIVDIEPLVDQLELVARDELRCGRRICRVVVPFILPAVPVVEENLRAFMVDNNLGVDQELVVMKVECGALGDSNQAMFALNVFLVQDIHLGIWLDPIHVVRLGQLIAIEEVVPTSFLLLVDSGHHLGREVHAFAHDAGVDQDRTVVTNPGTEYPTVVLLVG